MKISPPDFTRKIEHCRFQDSKGLCCHALNYLRPHKCNEYCVKRLDDWLRESHPSLHDGKVIAIVKGLTHHET